MKPKTNRKGDKDQPMGFDSCQTPPYAVAPLVKYIPKSYRIWEPACGMGMMASALRGHGYDVIDTDILTGSNFFEFEPAEYDCIVTNPPYSAKYSWLERCYLLGKPFALLIPVESIGAWKAQRLYREYGTQFLFLNKRVDFIMPVKGDESSAQFLVFWSCCDLLDDQVEYGDITKPSKRRA
jgi:hypothetical protein